MSNLLQTGAGVEKKLKERAETTEKKLKDEVRKLEKTVNKAGTPNETKKKKPKTRITKSHRDNDG
ncbi:MbeB family mobilization protein, partial [Escherichia coli]|uniref:MbeB family mobilization protein n=1 Tax=Escherichia coli TaxID=562 RepID=UPI002378C5B4